MESEMEKQGSLNSEGGAVRRLVASFSILAAASAAAMDIGVCAHVGRDEFAERERAYDMMRDAGISWVRTDFEWFRCQKDKDRPFDFSLYDTVVDDARARGLEVLPIFWSPPKWAQPDLSNIAGTRPLVVQPDTSFMDAWRAFVREAALHFKGRFSAIEIWNEENHPAFWLNPDAAAYVLVLKAAYEEIKKIDPGIQVVGPNVTGDLGGEMAEFLDAFGRAGGFAYTDILSFHPYSSREEYSPYPADQAIRDIRKILKKYHAEHLPLWDTELYYIKQLHPHYAKQDEFETWRFLRRLLIDLGEGVKA